MTDKQLTITAYTQVQMEGAEKLLNIPKSVWPDISMSREYIYDPVILFERNVRGTLVGKTVEKNIDGIWLGKSTKLGMSIASKKTKVTLIKPFESHQNDRKATEFSSFMEERENCQTMQQDVWIPNFLLEQPRIPGLDKPREKNSALSYDMERHARKYVKPHLELANKNVEQFSKFPVLVWTITKLKGRIGK